MYYKIENTECEVYKALHELRTEELRIEEENKDLIKEKVGLTYSKFLGGNSQQNWRRVQQYQGFVFDNPDQVDPKVWKESKEHPGCFIPNRKYKVGRDMYDFLLNGMKGSRFDTPLQILDLHTSGRFSFPYMEIIDDVILLFLDDQHEPEDSNVIEITRKEFRSFQEKLIEKSRS